VVIGKIIFEFFEKPIASNLVVHTESALSEETKLSSLGEEVHKRLRNISLDANHTKRMEIIERVCTKMATSGQTDKFILKALRKGLDSFNENVRRSKLPVDNKMYRPLYHGKKLRRLERDGSKSLKKKTWYGAGGKRNEKAGKRQPLTGNNIPTKTVVFVPSTKGGLLVRKLREKENTLGGMT
jgi:hypothetical protein